MKQENRWDLMKDRNTNINQLIKFILIISAFAVLAFWLVPRILSLHYQTRGGNLLNEIIPFQERNNLSTISCLFEPLQRDTGRDKVISVIGLLNRAVQFNEESSHSYLLLGRAYCLLGQYENSINSYEKYTKMRPDNTLGHLELGFAYERICRNAKVEENQICSEDSLKSRVINEWRMGGATVTDFIQKGNDTFSAQRYEESAEWFERAVILENSLSISDMFQWSVSKIIAGNPLPSPELVTIYPISDTTTIEAETFQWLLKDRFWNVNYGDKLMDHSSNVPGVGVMWWAGAAGTIIQVPEQGIYRISIRVKDFTSGELKLQVEKNLVPIDRFVLPLGDGSWHELETATVLPEGIHLLSLRFMEDNGDAHIDWVKVIKIN